MYDELMDLCLGDESPFYHVDQVSPSDGETYRIFIYRLAQYSDFLKPSALECRGIMFRLADLKLVCRPMEKFFNLNENPFTSDLDLSEVDDIQVKADGSLISAWLDAKGDLQFKSKGSIQSDHVGWVHQYMLRSSNQKFASDISRALYDGWTVNMEYVAPHNHIVIFYPDEDLIVLNLRNIESGEYMSRDEIQERYPYLAERLIPSIETDDPVKFIQSVNEMNDGPEDEVIEGFVFTHRSGQRVKVKTKRYLQLHAAKDNITNPKRIIELILDERIDDIKSAFAHAPELVDYIVSCEQVVVPIYNHLIHRVETFYNENADLDRKSFALKAKDEMGDAFPLVMSMYSGKQPDYKKFILNKADDVASNFKPLVSGNH